KPALPADGGAGDRASGGGWRGAVGSFHAGAAWHTAADCSDESCRVLHRAGAGAATAGWLLRSDLRRSAVFDTEAADVGGRTARLLRCVDGRAEGVPSVPATAFGGVPPAAGGAWDALGSP